MPPAKPAVCAALVQKGRLLLGKRIASKTLDPLKWALFGGHVQAGETADQAVRRELHEELGIVIDRPRYIGRLREMDETNRYLTDVYVVAQWEGDPVNREEHEEIRWVSPHELDGLDLSPGLVAIIDELGLLEKMAEG